MRISTTQLRDITIQVAREQFGDQVFARRALMDAVERRLRESDFWDAESDDDSQSAGKKSKGLARIDWSISRAKLEGRLLNVGRDQWQVPPA